VTIEAIAPAAPASVPVPTAEIQHFVIARFVEDILPSLRGAQVLPDREGVAAHIDGEGGDRFGIPLLVDRVIAAARQRIEPSGALPKEGQWSIDFGPEISLEDAERFPAAIDYSDALRTTLFMLSSSGPDLIERYRRADLSDSDELATMLQLERYEAHLRMLLALVEHAGRRIFIVNAALFQERDEREAA